MRYKIHSTELAEYDLEKAADYIAYVLCNPSAAISFVRGVRKKIESLEYFPERFELDEDLELAKAGVRKLFYKNYKIYYVINKHESVIYIIRILHRLENSQFQIYKTLKLKNNEKREQAPILKRLLSSCFTWKKILLSAPV